jgi:hypothetical protein
LAAVQEWVARPACGDDYRAPSIEQCSDKRDDTNRQATRRRQRNKGLHRVRRRNLKRISGSGISKERAKEIARRFDDPHRAPAFFVAWRDLHGAAQLVRDRLKEFDGRDYVTLAAAGAAAEALAGKQPVAATLLYRRMVESILGRASVNQYGYAVRDVRHCESLAGQLPGDAGIEGHDAFMARLRKEHGRKARFWELVREGT